MIARLVAALALFAVVALVAPPAQADPDARTQAAAHVRQGQAFFQRGDFDRALAEYQAALDLSSEPSLIFNIALCHDRANRPEPALKAFLHYLELAPAGSVAEEARSDVARLTPIVEKIVADRAAEDARQREQAAQRAEAARRAEADRQREEAGARRVRLSRYVMLAGAVVAAGGGGVHLWAWRTSGQAEAQHDPKQFLAERNTSFVGEDVAFGLYAAGGATLAVGLVLALTAPRAGDGPQLSAAILPGGAAMSVAWSR